MHVAASIQSTRTEKTVSKSFPFSCSEPFAALCKRNESEMCKFRSLSLLTFDEIREPFRDVSGVILLVQERKFAVFSRPVQKFSFLSHTLQCCVCIGNSTVSRDVWYITASDISKFIKISRAAATASDIWGVLKYHEPIFISNTPKKPCCFLFILQGKRNLALYVTGVVFTCISKLA